MRGNMDKRASFSLRTRLLMALAAALPDAQHEHPDAQVLFDVLAQPAAEEQALLPLVEVLGLRALEHACLSLALWVEFDARIAAALALVQGNAARAGPSRPTLGLLANLATRLDETGHESATAAIGELLRGPALASGLLQLGDAQQLAHARTVSVTPALVALLANAGATPTQSTIPLGRLKLCMLAHLDWPLPRAWRAGSEHIAQAADNARTPCAIVLRGADDGELRGLAAHLARLLGRTALEIQGNEDTATLGSAELVAQAEREGAVPALLLCRAAPVWHAATVPGQPTRLPMFAHWQGPLIVLAGPDDAFWSSQAVHELELSAPDSEDRLAIWNALQGGAAGHGETTNRDLDREARTPQGPKGGSDHHARAVSAADRAAVARSCCGSSVLVLAAGLSRDGLSAEAAIEQAVRSSARALSGWARISVDRIPADAWVGPPHVRRELGLLLTRCLARADAGAQLGPLLRGRLDNGVKALFIGASGTGKTLAAQWVADRLARPLVKVDLASVVSKYIGETEKNLAQLLARAEHLDAVLLFDEADSLFGARTDVKQANDRYANMQTNYLLQRLETFHGVALLTSNSKARFDDAFLRRLDAVVEFPLPDVGERRLLWALHMGEMPSLDASLLGTVAALVDLPGGHIRNAVLTAALLARQRRQEPGGDALAPVGVQARDLREALALEYRKLGQRAPDSLGI